MYMRTVYCIVYSVYYILIVCKGVVNIIELNVYYRMCDVLQYICTVAAVLNKF